MSIPLAMSPVGYDTWVTELKRALYDYLGQTSIEVEYLSSEKKLVINTDKVSEEEYAEVANIAAEYMPTGTTLEQYNYIVPFIRLDYLESNGTQYIDTGIKLSNESEVECEFALTNKKNTTAALYIDETNPDARFSSFVEISSSASRWDFASQLVFADALDLNKNYSLIHNSTGVTLNGEQIVSFSSTSAFETGGPLIFWGKRGSFTSVCKIFSCSISRNSRLQLNFIPCLNPVGKPCMYDTVTGTVFYNQGTGDDFDFGAKYTNELQFSKALSMLPASSTVRIFKVSVPEEVLASPLIQKLMQKCRTEKNWIIQTIN